MNIKRFVMSAAAAAVVLCTAVTPAFAVVLPAHVYVTSNLPLYGQVADYTCPGGGTPTDSTFGWVKMWTPLDGMVHGVVIIKGGLASTTYDIWVNQDPGGCPQSGPTSTVTTDPWGNGLGFFAKPLVGGATHFWVSAVSPHNTQVLRSPAGSLY